MDVKIGNEYWSSDGIRYTVLDVAADYRNDTSGVVFRVSADLDAEKQWMKDEDFKKFFIPTVLTVGDEIFTSRNNTNNFSTYRIAQVDTEEGTARAVATIGTEEITVHSYIQPNGEVLPTDTETVETPFFYCNENYAKVFTNRENLRKMRNTLTDGINRISRISPITASSISTSEALNSVTQTLERIYNRFGV